MTSEAADRRLGLFNSTSQKWWVSYNGSTSARLGVVALGVYEFIFRGDDSLTGAVVQLTAGGGALGFGVNRLGKKRLGGKGRSQRQRSSEEEDVELAEEALNLNDSMADHRELMRSSAPWCNMANVSLKTAKRPFSLYDLDQSWGGIEWAGESNILIDGAAILSINASSSVVSAYSESDPSTLFEGWTVFNRDDGSVGASLYWVQGKWSVVRWGDLYTKRCPIKGRPGLENFYSSSPKLRHLLSPNF